MAGEAGQPRRNAPPKPPGADILFANVHAQTQVRGWWGPEPGGLGTASDSGSQRPQGQVRGLGEAAVGRKPSTSTEQGKMPLQALCRPSPLIS